MCGSDGMTTAATELAAGDPAQEDAPATHRRRGGGGLGSYLLIRFLLIFPTVFILVTTVFFLMRSTGDPITAALGGRLTAEELARRVSEAGYDRPLFVQYLEYLGNVSTGDFGTTLSDRRPVTEVLTTFGTATLELAVAGRASTRAEIQLQFLDDPTGIYLIDALRLGDSAVVLDVLEHAVLPAVALGLLTAGVFLRLVRTNVIGTLGTGYVEAARSRGVAERRLLRKHAYRPAPIPIITVLGPQIALLLGGAVLTETTFEWKGPGVP